MCCSGGKVQLPNMEPYPGPLYSLLTHQDPLSDHFLSTIRKYNGCFQMTSSGAKEIKEGNFMPTFKVQRQVYHRIGSLMAGDHQKLSFLQIYFMGDDPREKYIRCGIYPGIKPELISQLQKSLHEHNKYIMDFKAAIDSVPKDRKEFKVVINAERKPFGEHRERFNTPQTKEVAVVIVGQEFEKRDIVLNCRDVDMFAKIESERLNWIRHNQKKLRSEEYIHLKDAITATDGQLSELGKMVVLPSSFTGGSRYMHERTQDAMTYVRHFGRPDLFITFTCNPKWTEIVDLLNQGQKSHDTHDIIARAFRVKVKHIMKLLTKGCIFGNVRCHMYTVEWQKRGLSDVHILLWLEDKTRVY
ncbi:ATP-dependent DNA helicase [Trichonephila clavata]|uniref:ATP-dependent DNA helicase n=1 Tax=Trichonephila clavata TaxID=2740835 RepID=A0A8X6LFM8_TRICU|nr:ATP-dependent DNA helicase [Trichonephila clavata]